jgi:hypothetical protein
MCILFNKQIQAHQSTDYAHIQQVLDHRTIFSKNSPQQLKFLSYNIQLSGFDTGNHAWKQRKYSVAHLISYADIVALQEISHMQLLDLERLLPTYAFVGLNSNGNDLHEYAPEDQEGMVMGFRKDSFEFKSSSLMWYSDTPHVPSKKWGTWNSAFAKCLQQVTLIIKSVQQELVIFNSHFAHDEDPSNIINPRVASSQLELVELKKLRHQYWISAGDRNFHHPRDKNAYQLYAQADYVRDSQLDAQSSGVQTTFLGYEDHPRVNKIKPDGNFEKQYNLDVVFHNPFLLKSELWISHIGEYDDTLKLLPFGICKQLNKRLFASDHTAIFVVYHLNEAEYPSYADYNHYGLCLRAKHDMPKNTIVATANFEKTDKPYIHNHDSPEHKYVALMDVTKDGTPVWGKVRGKWAFCNHSCDPNCDVSDSWKIITNRDVLKGQELTTSYNAYVANFPWQETWNFVCLCQSPNCKKIINEYRMDIMWPTCKS